MDIRYKVLVLAGFLLVVPSASAHDGPFALKLGESDGQEWQYEVMRDSSWTHFDIPLSLFGSGVEFLNTPVTKFMLIPIGGSSLGNHGNEVVDWLDSIVIANLLIDDFDDSDFGDWLFTVALNGSYLNLSADTSTPDLSLRCLKLVHGNTMASTFGGWLWKEFPGLSLSAGDTLRLWLRGLSYEMTDVESESSSLPGHFSLFQNHPNPFNPSTRIAYRLPTRSNVTLKVYNLLGQVVTTLVNGVEEPGYKSVQWNASGVASGVYLYQIKAGSFVDVKKLVLLR